MIKTFNGNHETTVDPSMMQAALDQGIRPVGYDAPITPITTDLTMMEVGYRKACKHMMERMEAMRTEPKYRYDRMSAYDNDGGSILLLRQTVLISEIEDLLANECWEG